MKRIETNKLFRSPFGGRAEIHYGETRYLDSPNEKFYLTFSHYREPHMGLGICLFNLINKRNKIVEKFEPLVAFGTGEDSHWSENSKLFSTKFMTRLVYGGYFIYNIEEKKFAIIRVENMWVLKSQLANIFFEIEYRDDQIPDRRETEKYPTKIFLKPENIKVKLDELIWYQIDEINNFEHIYNSKQVISLNPIDKEFRFFDGEFPLSTDRIIWEIEKFAEYGDEQSEIWLNEINELTNGDYDKWQKASKYIGQQERENGT